MNAPAETISGPGYPVTHYVPTYSSRSPPALLLCRRPSQATVVASKHAIEAKRRPILSAPYCNGLIFLRNFAQSSACSMGSGHRLQLPGRGQARLFLVRVDSWALENPQRCEPQTYGNVSVDGVLVKEAHAHVGAGSCVLS